MEHAADEQHDDGPFSDDERRALAAWQAPEPPAGFAASVVARARNTRPKDAGIVSGLAVAAGFILVMGGVLALTARREPRLDTPGAPNAPKPEGTAALPMDAGPRPEVRLAWDAKDHSS